MSAELQPGCPPVRVLVVDDNWDVRFLMERALGRLGVEVTGASGGSVALQILERGEHDAVVLDVQMPDMDGWDVLERIRMNASTSAMPVILCTVKGRPADTVRAWELGCDGYVTKPFVIDALVDELCRVLQVDPDERLQVRARKLAKARKALRADAVSETG